MGSHMRLADYSLYRASELRGLHVVEQKRKSWTSTAQSSGVQRVRDCVSTMSLFGGCSAGPLLSSLISECDSSNMVGKEKGVPKEPPLCLEAANPRDKGAVWKRACRPRLKR